LEGFHAQRESFQHFFSSCEGVLISRTVRGSMSLPRITFSSGLASHSLKRVLLGDVSSSFFSPHQGGQAPPSLWRFLTTPRLVTAFFLANYAAFEVPGPRTFIGSLVTFLFKSPFFNQCRVATCERSTLSFNFRLQGGKTIEYAQGCVLWGFFSPPPFFFSRGYQYYFSTI